MRIQIPASKASGYRVRIGTEILGRFWQQIEQDFGTLSKFIVTDENLVRCGHLSKLLGDAPASFCRKTEAGPLLLSPPARHQKILTR